MAATHDFGKKESMPDEVARVQRDEHATPSTGHPSPSPPYQESGPLINRKETLDREWASKASNAALLWPRIRHYCRKPFAEFMGTFILIMFGDGVVAQVSLIFDDGWHHYQLKSERSERNGCKQFRGLLQSLQHCTGSSTSTD